MFKLNRKSQHESVVADLCRHLPGKVFIEPTYVKFYLADVDTMCTIYLKTKQMSNDEILDEAMRSTAVERHHQIYI
jgi:hypothetical protein